MSRARSQIDIAAPTSAVMALITDFATYPSFLPWMRSVDLLRHERAVPEVHPEAWEVRFEATVIRPLSYTLRLERDGELALSWSLVEGVFRTNEGAWTLEPTDAGTRATYELELVTGSFVPTSLMRSLIGHDLPDLLGRFRDEAELRQGA